jgi:hypothetical protein
VLGQLRLGAELRRVAFEPGDSGVI